MSFDGKKSNFDKVQFIIFSFMINDFSVLRNTCLLKGHENIQKTIYNISMGLYMYFPCYTIDIFVYPYADKNLP